MGSSYGAFMAPLGHIAARLHAIGAQARQSVTGEPYKPIFLVCAHAGLKTGEDGPTHADPQPLQLLQENFPLGTMISLTPWEPQEIWPLVAAALAKRPALIAPFVTRPNETVLDRAALGLAPAEAANTGVYVLRRPQDTADVTLVLQESAVTYAFVEEALPLLLAEGIDPLVFYVASAELFDLLPVEEQRRLFPEERAREAMGITGFTLPTMYRWVRSDAGLAATLHPYRKGHFLGSGQGEVVLAEAGLDGESQYRAIRAYLDARLRAEAARAPARRLLPQPIVRRPFARGVVAAPPLLRPASWPDDLAPRPRRGRGTAAGGAGWGSGRARRAPRPAVAPPTPVLHVAGDIALLRVGVSISRAGCREAGELAGRPYRSRGSRTSWCRAAALFRTRGRVRPGVVRRLSCSC